MSYKELIECSKCKKEKMCIGRIGNTIESFITLCDECVNDATSENGGKK